MLFAVGHGTESQSVSSIQQQYVGGYIATSILCLLDGFRRHLFARLHVGALSVVLRKLMVSHRFVTTPPPPRPNTTAPSRHPRYRPKHRH